MIALPDEVVQGLGIATYRALEKFYSRRNEVWKLEVKTCEGVDRLLVAKRFSNSSHCSREAGLLSGLAQRGAPVPEVLYHWSGWMVTEYIEGPLLLDVFFCEPLLLMFGDNLERLYRALGQIDAGIVLGDMNLRNFILNRERNRIYRVDLESAGAGDVPEDLGKLCAFCLTYDPPFTEDKMEITRALLHHLVGRLQAPVEQVKEEVLLELLRIESRRRMTVPYEVRVAVAAW